MCIRDRYQIGLLGLIREQNLYPSLKLMGRALARLDSLHGGVARSRLCWIGAAAIESIVDGQLLPRKSRKQLFSRIDRELKQLLDVYKRQAESMADLHQLRGILYLFEDTVPFLARQVARAARNYLAGLLPPFFRALVEHTAQSNYSWHTRCV